MAISFEHHVQTASASVQKDGLITLLLFAFAACGLYVSSLYTYLLFHTLVEIFCILILLSAFLLAWNSRRLLDNHYFLFLAISFLSSGTLELLHTFSYKGFGIFTGYDANLPTQFWIAFRYVFSLSFLAAPFFINRRLNVVAAATGFAALTALLTAFIFSGIFPDCFREGAGLTPFKIYSEYLIIVILLGAIALLLRNKTSFDPRVLRMLVWSLLAATFAEAAFTKYVSVFGPANLAGHIFLFLAACLIYRAIVVTGLKEPAVLLFRNLELSKEQFRTAIAQAPIPVVMQAEDGEVLQVSHNWVEVTGYPLEEMQPLDAWLKEAVPGPGGDALRAEMRELFSGERGAVGAEIPILTRDGRSRYWNFSAASPGTLQDGRRFVVGMAADITERREGEAALQKSNLRLDLLASSASRLLASDAPQQLVDELCRRVMCYLDCDTYFNYLVDEEAGRLRLNSCGGVGAEDAAGIEWLDYGVAVCGCVARDACRIVADNVQDLPDPRMDLVKSLGIRAYACHPLMSRGRVLGTLSFGARTRDSFSADDISLMNVVADQVAIALERKITEEKLHQAKQAAEAASRTKSRFLANMSHELRTPMTGVLGMLDLALQSHPGQQQAECIKTAYRSGRSLLQILNDILDLAKVEAGKFSLDERPFRLYGCIEDASDMVVPETLRKGIELHLELAEDLPVRVVGDQVRLRQVLTNLVGNAVKFTDRGAVTVQVRGGEQTPEGEMEIFFSVSDTGIGIPDDKRDLLFNAFSQVDDSHTRSYGGTGLGLAISREIVERMGGKIGFESEEGKGSTFFFSVRLAVAEAGAEAADAPAGASPCAGDPGADGKRLLIAEDDPTIRQVLGTMLERLRFQVDFAEDGQKVVEMWQQGGYDLILMDVQMPRQDGFQATRAIRELENGGRVPIIAMTAHAMKEDEKRCIDAGMDDYISKPIDFRECLDKVRKLTANGAVASWAARAVGTT